MITPPRYQRSSGVLMHVTSLPSSYGIGDLGPAARAWVDWLASSGTRYWQLLPLGPTGFGNSPYSSFSSHAGNVDLISPEDLVSDGLLRDDEFGPVGEPGRVDYETVGKHKSLWLEAALTRLSGDLMIQFADFRDANQNWLEPYSLFMALKQAHGGGSWTGWPDDLKRRDPTTLHRAGAELKSEVDLHAFGQFIFRRQLDVLRSHAGSNRVEIIGDVPLYVAPDSVDVWLNPELFTLHPNGEPSHIAGVPPDMFSATGQRWGNPLYRWERHADEGFVWWAERLRAFFGQADVLRIDHFTGLVTYYEIEASIPTAMGGTWRPGPGADFFEAVESQLGPLRVIVEDMGPAGQVVEDVRAELGYPGMEILQEAFGAGQSVDAIAEDRVVYTGTHDNDTAKGRLLAETAAYRKEALAYAGDSEDTYPDGLIERAWKSDGVIAVVPLQDLLGLGSEGRMNFPGTTEGNWQWRAMPGAITQHIAAHLKERNQRNNRRP